MGFVSFATAEVMPCCATSALFRLGLFPYNAACPAWQGSGEQDGDADIGVFRVSGVAGVLSFSFEAGMSHSCSEAARIANRENLFRYRSIAFRFGRASEKMVA